MSKTLLVTIESTGRIPALGCDGPILVPTHLDANMVRKLVMNGVKINEHDPMNIHHKVAITRKNISENRFPPVVPEPPVTPVGKEIPEVSLEKPAVEVPQDDDSIDEVSSEEDTTSEEVVEETKTYAQNVAPTPTPDRYAGMSKNQRKRARQAEAEARARANNPNA